MTLKVLILGANGFIGSSLIETALQSKNWQIYAMDIASHNLTPYLCSISYHILIKKESLSGKITAGLLVWNF